MSAPMGDREGWRGKPDAAEDTPYVGRTEIGSPPAVDPADAEQVAAPEAEEGQAEAVGGTLLVLDSAFLSRAVEGSAIDEAMNSCSNWNGGEGFYRDRDERRLNALALAYVLYLHMLWLATDDRRTALTEVFKNPYFTTYQRLPWKADLAYIAFLLVMKPITEEHRNECSEWALFLVWAAMQEVHPAAFVQHMSGVTLKRCKADVRATRAAVRAQEDEAADTGDAGAVGGQADAPSAVAEAGTVTPAANLAQGGGPDSHGSGNARAKGVADVAAPSPAPTALGGRYLEFRWPGADGKVLSVMGDLPPSYEALFDILRRLPPETSAITVVRALAVAIQAVNSRRFRRPRTVG